MFVSGAWGVVGGVLDRISSGVSWDDCGITVETVI